MQIKTLLKRISLRFPFIKNKIIELDNLRNLTLQQEVKLNEIRQEKDTLSRLFSAEKEKYTSATKEIHNLNRKLITLSTQNKMLVKENKLLQSSFLNLQKKYAKTKDRLSEYENILPNINNENKKYIRHAYAQEGEDLVFLAFYEGNLQYNGFYIDIGAFHPYRFSNTQVLYEKGWRGINIDATPGSMRLFEKYRPEDINLEIGIGNSDSKKLTYYMFNEPALNGFDKALTEDRVKKGYKLIGTKDVQIIDINKILNKHMPKNKGIDFMNIDIEGFDIDILEILDWKKFAPKFLLIEDLSLVDKDVCINIKNNQIYAILRKHNYTLVAKTRRTLFFKQED